MSFDEVAYEGLHALERQLVAVEELARHKAASGTMSANSGAASRWRVCGVKGR